MFKALFAKMFLFVISLLLLIFLYIFDDFIASSVTQKIKFENGSVLKTELAGGVTGQESIKTTNQTTSGRNSNIKSATVERQSKSRASASSKPQKLIVKSSNSSNKQLNSDVLRAGSANQQQKKKGPYTYLHYSGRWYLAEDKNMLCPISKADANFINKHPYGVIHNLNLKKLKNMQNSYSKPNRNYPKSNDQHTAIRSEDKNKKEYLPWVPGTDNDGRHYYLTEDKYQKHPMNKDSALFYYKNYDLRRKLIKNW